MAYTDSNGILRVEDSDNISPINPLFNGLAQSVSDRFNADIQIHRVANETARNQLGTSVSPTPTSANPLFVWRANAAAGQQLEYTRNGSTWFRYQSTEFSDDTGWVAATLQGGFSPYYSSGVTPVFRKIGKMVTFYGAVTGPVTTSVNSATFTTVPPQFLPEQIAGTINFTCQGSGSNRWTLIVSDGVVGAGRYGPAGPGANVWLPFYVQWLTA